MFIQVDLSDADGVAKVIKGTLECLDGVDILVNNVGSSSLSRGDAVTLSRGNWVNTFNTNLFSVVQLDQGLLRSMLKQHAVFVPW
jgi:NAD(P)-dependent dehydrogenase (short-subunit alcohol dehydrogenase family)